MSIDIMTAVWKRGPEEQSRMVVLLALADNANDQGICWPEIKTIAHKARMHERTAMRTTQALAAEGWMEIEHKAVGDKGRKGNRYHLNLAKLGVTNSHDKKSRDIKSPDQKPGHDPADKSGDTVSRENAEEKPVEMPGKSTEKVSQVTESHVTPRTESGDKTGISQVTKTPKSGDKSNTPQTPIRKNHQEPSRNHQETQVTKPIPPTPLGGGVENDSEMPKPERVEREIGGESVSYTPGVVMGLEHAAAHVGECSPGEAPRLSEGSVGWARALWTGVVDEVSEGLWAGRAGLGKPPEGAPHLVDGHEEWTRYRFGELAVEDVERDGSTDALVLRVRSPDARATQAGLAKYTRRWDQALRSWFREPVQMVLER